MFWADRLAKHIIDSGKHTPYWVDDMKTPSGRIHVGSLRGVVIHDLVHRALKSMGKDVTFSYVFEDHDPMDGLPVYLDANTWKQHLGKPLFSIPSPGPGADNYAQYFAYEFKSVFNKVGSYPEIIWGSELYRFGRMNDGIKTCLDNVEVIRDIYKQLYEKVLPKDWYPFHVVCPQCGKESTTKVTDWNGTEVTFSCNVDAVDWTQGCGYEGKTSPFSTKEKFVGKLPWKVEWPVKWQAIGVTIEGGGKDHMSAGGSYDAAKLICERVLKYPLPFAVPHEFFLIGGKKMSSSKGVGSSATEVSEIIPPYLLRFIFTRTDYNQAMDFNPVGTMEIPDWFDEYDRCWIAYNQTEGDLLLSRAFELAQINELPAKNPLMFLPRFRDVVNYIQQPTVNIYEKFEEVKKSPLTTDERMILDERVKYAKIWLEAYAPDELRLHLTKELPIEAQSLMPEQRLFLSKIAALLDIHTDPESLQVALYTLAKEMGLTTKQAFNAIYISFLGKTHGPKAAWFLLQYPREQVVKRLTEASSNKSEDARGEIEPIHKPELFVMNETLKKQYPSISVGIAVIKNVQIEKSNEELEKEKLTFLNSLAGLTTELLGKHPEIQSYRKLYKEMGIDWHSRRPSPEALLRRVALGKGLYSVNTCVDAYNLVVMKHRVSVGAFDYDQIHFPTILQYAGQADEILLLGDSEPTKYTAKEIAYYDQQGGYNIDFNFRDAQRTMVTQQTKNLWINVDGVFDITPAQVERSLKETVAIIQKYCGGEVEVMGVVR